MSPWTDRHWRRIVTAVATLALIAAACGGDNFDEQALGTTQFPTPTATLPATVGTTGTTVDPVATPVPVVPPTPLATPTLLPTPTPEVRTTSIQYTIASGDVLGIIAERYDVSLQSLLDANPGVSATSLQLGQSITIPPADGAVSGDPAVTTPTAVPTAGPTATPVVVRERTAGAVDQYIVAAGDFASNIAITFGVSVDALAGANGEDNIDALFVGQCLIIPPVGSTTSAVIASSATLCPGSTGGTAATATPVPAATATPDPAATATPTPTPDPNATPTVTPVATATAAPTVTPSPTPINGIVTQTPVPTATPTPGGAVATATPTPGVDPTHRAINADYSAEQCALDGGTLIGTGGFTCDLPG